MVYPNFESLLGPNQPLQPGMDLQEKSQGRVWDFLKGLKEFNFGTPTKIGSLQKFAPYQQNAMYNLLGMGMQGMLNPTAGFEPIAQQARTQFQQQTIPSLAERFGSLGSNALSSPAFATQMGQAGSNFEQGLAALQSQYGMQQQSNLMRLLGLGLQPQFENVTLPGQEGLQQQILRALPQILAAVI